MRFERSPLPGAVVIELEPHHDERGSFARTFCAREFAAAGLPATFPQANLSHNLRAATLRGLHLNIPGHGEDKVVRCVRGAVFDVVVDLRPDSPTYMGTFGIELDAVSGRSLFVAAGMAHGFVTLADDTAVEYLMGSYHEPEWATGFRWDDPAFAISWPRRPAVISTRDATYTDFDDASWRAAHDG